MTLTDKLCIVTGGGSGIGKSTAALMASKGARVILVGRTMSKLMEVQKTIEDRGGSASSMDADISDNTAVKRLVEIVLKDYGHIDVLVNNAGHSSQYRKLLTSTPDDMQSVLNSNLLGTIYLTQSVVPIMLKQKQGTVINLSSMAGVNPGLLHGMIYSAVKSAIINFTGFLNAEFKNTGLRASVVLPGEVDTPALDIRPVNPSRESRDTMVMADDVAEAITLIASLPQRACIPELRIRPTILRDYSSEAGKE